MSSRGPAVLLLTSLVLAGCSGGGSNSGGGEVPSPSAYVWGFVLDDELRPVSDATVGFVLANGSVVVDVTQAEGHYRIGPVPAGRFHVSAQHLGYLGTQVSLVLLPGQEKRLDLELAPIARSSIFNETLSFQGRYECATVSPAGTGSCDGPVQQTSGQGVFQSNARHPFVVQTGWGGLLLELNWTVGGGQESLAGVRLTMVAGPNNTTYVQFQGPQSPTRSMVNVTQLHAGAAEGAVIPRQGLEAVFIVEPIGREGVVGGATELDYTIWATTYFHSTVDVGYSALGG